MKKLFVLSLITFASCLGQQQPPVTPTPPCVIPFFMSVGGGGAQLPVPLAGFDNRQSGCTNWDITYTSTGYTGITLAVESAPTSDNTAPGTAGTWVTFAGTVVTGINPNTAITQAETTLTGYFPWIRIHLTASATLSVGNIVGVMIGTTPISASGGTAAAGCPNPCPVIGPTAAGSPPTTAPVLVAGFDALGNVIDLLPLSPGGAGVQVNGSQPEGFQLGLDPPVRIAGTQGTTIHSIQTDANGNLQVQSIGNGAVLSNQQAVTNAAVALATNASKNICVKGLSTNTASVYIGPTGITTATGMELAPGDAYCGPVSNTNLIFVIAAAGGQTVSWLATN